MILAGLFYCSYMLFLILLVRMYDVRGYYHTIHADGVVVQSFYSRLADKRFLK